ncbi:MAG: hypothetical protein ACTSWC_01955 [Promethearchaeota archaeon]
MILCLQICDSRGFPFFTRTFAGFPEINGVLLSGMVSAIGSLGQKLFHQDIATISFGSGVDLTYMVVIAKNLYFQKKAIYFVFYLKDNCDLKRLREIATTIYIENKGILNVSNFDVDLLKKKIDVLINTKFSEFQLC